MPSLKYSFSASELILTKGKTATDFPAGGAVTDGDAAGGGGAGLIAHHSRHTLTTTMVAAIAAIVRRARGRAAGFDEACVHGNTMRYTSMGT
jgi:hypothetical protein